MKRLYLIDVSSLFFRAFYAIRSLNNASGMPTNALYGFLAAITKLLKEHKPDGMVFCFDRPETGFREELYPEYKANRDEAPSDLIKQIPYLPILADALSIPAFERPGFEADDIIGTLVKESKQNGIEVVIVSGDKDFAQLVEPGVIIFDPAKDKYMDSDGVFAKFGVHPNQIIDYLALVGDASDNVPGVKGIGPKGACKLLAEYKTLDGIYNNLETIKNERLRELLTLQKDSAYLSQKLCAIHCDMALGIKVEDLQIKPVKRELLEPLLEELNFKSLLHRLLGETASESRPEATMKPGVVTVVSDAAPKPEVTVTGQINDVEKALGGLQDGAELWLDVTPRGTILQSGSHAFRFEGASDAFSHWLNDFLKTRNINLAGFDTKTMAHLLHLKPESFKAVSCDVLLQSYCLGKGDGVEFNVLAKKYLGAELPEFALPEERLYAIRQMSTLLDRQLEAEGTQSVLKEIEQPLIPILFGMEKTGVLIDSEKLNQYSSVLLSEAQGLEKEICAMAGYDFNVGSPKQLGLVLFEKLKLPTVRKTKTGYSTDSDVLEKLSAQHPICQKILDWRELSKLRSTYVDALPRLADSHTGRVHTSYNQATTSTGRLSSVHPNLQNIPIRTEKGQRIRESFIAPPGSVLISADYSQVELRILAHITDDPGLKKAFAGNVDIHTATASEVFNVKVEDVTPDHRRASKAINFGIAYGMSDFGLSESLGVEREVAAEYIALYFKRYPGVQRYMHDVVENGKRDQYVETLFKRRRYYPDLNASNGRLRQVAERAAINMPIQGAAADIIKKAMIKTAGSLKSNPTSAQMLLQVHDELIFEVKVEEAEALKLRIKDWMEEAVQLSVPLSVSIGIGPNWGDAH